MTCFQTVEIEDNNVMIDGRNFFDQSFQNEFSIYKHFLKVYLVKGIITQLTVY